MYNQKLKTVLLAIGFAFIGFTSVHGQSASNTVNSDSINYQLYLQGNWTALIESGEKMIDNGIDYYYLRMRLGIAELNKKNYRRAEDHFRQAEFFFPTDQIAKKYLFSALNATNKTVEAGSLYKGLNTISRKETSLKNGFDPFSVHVDAGAVFRNKTEGLNFNQLSGVDGVFGQESLYNNNMFYDAGLHFKMAPNLLFYTGFQSINIVATDRFAYLESQLVRDSTAYFSWGEAYYYELKSTPTIAAFDNNLSQQAVYLQAQWGPSTKWSLTSGLHVLSVKRKFTISTSIPITITDTSFFDKTANRAGLFNIDLKQTTFREISWKTTDYSLSLNAKRHFTKITALAGIAHASINKTPIFQLNTGFVFLPLGNLNLFNQSELFYINTDGQQNWAVKTRLGGKIIEKTWIEAELIAGSLNNLSDQNGYIVYNNPEKLRLQFETIVTQFLTDRLQFKLRYRLLQAERNYSTWNVAGKELIDNTYSIQSQSLIGGFLWKF